MSRLTHQVAFAFLALSGATYRGTAQPAYRVGPNVQVTRAGDGHMVQETYLCADPRRSGRLLAAAIVEHGDTAINQFLVSTNGGASWAVSLSIAPGVDPSCAIGSGSVALAASVHDSTPSGDSYLDVHRSMDGGRTWTQSTIYDNARNLDRAYITAGPAGRDRARLRGRAQSRSAVGAARRNERNDANWTRARSADAGRRRVLSAPAIRTRAGLRPTIFKLLPNTASGHVPNDRARHGAIGRERRHWRLDHTGAR